MKKHQFFTFAILMTLICSLFQGCARTGNDVWEDTKSCGRHVQRGVRALGGKQGDSRQIRSRNEFDCIEDDGVYLDGGYQDCDYQGGYSQNCDFIPLEDQENDLASADMIARPPRETPGDPGSSIPCIDAFRDPSTMPQMTGVFRNIYFEYNSCLVKGQDSLQTIHNIAEYMRRNRNVYVFVEGHADERGPQAYNFSLGARRANAVRNLLISEGVSPDNLFTISYGKERPLVMEHHEEAWSKNRRTEFKVYVR